MPLPHYMHRSSSAAHVTGNCIPHQLRHHQIRHPGTGVALQRDSGDPTLTVSPALHLCPSWCARAGVHSQQRGCHLQALHDQLANRARADHPARAQQPPLHFDLLERITMAPRGPALLSSLQLDRFAGANHHAPLVQGTWDDAQEATPYHAGPASRKTRRRRAARRARCASPRCRARWSWPLPGSIRRSRSAGGPSGSCARWPGCRAPLVLRC